MGFIDLNNISVSYDKKINVLENFNLSIEEGKLVSLLGPSGCGKTTTLRVIAGFIEPNSGKLTVGEKDFTKTKVHKRNFGLVFQSYALFPHLTVFENVAFGLKLKKCSKDEIKKKVDEVLEVMDMISFSKRYPQDLSGGQRQRVAIARAIVVEPKILLLDEPLSNLDAKLRLKMRVEIRKIQQRLGITTVFVTHDQEECFSISDKVAVMNKGVVEQYDTPEKIYANPATEFVARFVGFENFIDVNKNINGEYETENKLTFKIDDKIDGNSDIIATIRPEDIEIQKKSNTLTENMVNGKVEVRTFLGKSYQYSVKTDIGIIIVSGANENIYEKGTEMTLYFPANKIVLVKK